MQAAASRQNHHGPKINQWSFKHRKTAFHSSRVEDFGLGDVWMPKNFLTPPGGGAAPALHHFSGRISDSGRGDERRPQNGEEESDARREDVTPGRRSCHRRLGHRCQTHSHIRPVRLQSRSAAPPPPRTRRQEAFTVQHQTATTSTSYAVSAEVPTHNSLCVNTVLPSGSVK